MYPRHVFSIGTVSSLYTRTWASEFHDFGSLVRVTTAKNGSTVTQAADCLEAPRGLVRPVQIPGRNVLILFAFANTT